ncbi:MAG: prephenate dehydrogenase [Ardenticatenaceae bacterium]
MPLNVTIIGMDALGQSIGLALKASTAAINVTAHDREITAAGEAKKRGAADNVEWNLLNAVEKADLVFLNEPIHQMRETMEHIAPVLRRDTVVTDTASVKSSVLQWAETIFPAHAHFVGGTPLVTAVAPDGLLFQNHRYAIIPLPRTDEAAVRLVTETVTLLGAQPLFIEPSEHESLMAAVRHLPALMGAALLQLTTQSQSWKEMSAMTDPAYNVATLLPTSDPTELAALMRHNRAAIVHWLGALRQELTSLQMLLENDDEGAALASRIASLIEAQSRWQRAEQHNPDVPTHAEAWEKAEEMRGLSRWFGFGFGKRRGE